MKFKNLSRQLIFVYFSVSFFCLTHSFLLAMINDKKQEDNNSTYSVLSNMHLPSLIAEETKETVLKDKQKEEEKKYPKKKGVLIFSNIGPVEKLKKLYYLFSKDSATKI